MVLVVRARAQYLRKYAKIIKIKIIILLHIDYFSNVIIKIKNYYEDYIDIPEEVRLHRVLKRDTYIGNEQQIIDKYKSRYFPTEHRYIEECQPQKNADFVVGIYF